MRIKQGEVEQVSDEEKKEHIAVELSGTSDSAQKGKGRDGLPGSEGSLCFKEDFCKDPGH